MVKKYNEKEISKLVNILKEDGVISVPTDTVYGLCGSINSKKAYNKIINLKQRTKNKSFAIMCANQTQIEEIANINENAKKIIENFMPGPITIILNKKDIIKDYITNNKETIAVRIATSKVLEKIILELNCPIFMTSANKSGEKECETLEEIEKTFPELDGILEGDFIFGSPSTIVDCSNNKIKILRKGPISSKEIRELLKIDYSI